MRFSLGVFTKRKQTLGFIEKVMGWDRAGIPSQFAVVPRGENGLIGYCGFFHHAEVPGEIEIGYRLHPNYWNRGLITEAARGARSRFHTFRIVARHFPHSSGKHSVSSRGGEKQNAGGKGNYVSRFSDAGVCDFSAGVAGELWRFMNSRARALYARAAGPLEAYSRIDLPKLGASLNRTLRGMTVS